MQQSQSIAKRRAGRDGATESGPLSRQLLCGINEPFAGKHRDGRVVSSSAAIATSSARPARMSRAVGPLLAGARAVCLGCALALVHDLDIHAANYGGQ